MISRTILTAAPYVFCFLLALGIAVAIMEAPEVEGFAMKDRTQIPWWAWIAMGLVWVLGVYLIAGPTDSRCERLGGVFDLYGDCDRIKRRVR